jgi:hypothetical protein
MNVGITDAALEELQKHEIPKGYGIRIDGEMTGG